MTYLRRFAQSKFFWRQNHIFTSHLDSILKQRICAKIFNFAHIYENHHLCPLTICISFQAAFFEQGFFSYEEFWENTNCVYKQSQFQIYCSNREICAIAPLSSPYLHFRPSPRKRGCFLTHLYWKALDNPKRIGYNRNIEYRQAVATLNISASDKFALKAGVFALYSLVTTPMAL